MTKPLTTLALWVFVLLVPLATSWPLMPPLIANVFPIYVTPVFYLSDIALLLLLLAGFIDGWRASPQVFFLPLIALVALGLLSAATALLPPLALYVTLRWTLAVVAYLMLSKLQLNLRMFVTALLISLSLQAIIGLAQTLRGGLVHLPGELPPSLYTPFLAGGVMIFRGAGLTFHPNVLGGLLAVGIVLALPLLQSWWVRLLWAVLWVGLFITFSRSAWLAVLIISPITMGLLARRVVVLRRGLLQTSLGLLLLLGIGGAIFAVPLISRLQRGQTDGSIGMRFDVWEFANQLITQHPLTGVGAGNFPVAMLLLHSPIPPDHTHNLPLQLAAEIGVIGSIIWLGIWFGVFYILWRKGSQPWAIVLGAAWSVMSLINFFDSYFWVFEAGRMLSISMLALIDHAITLEPRPPVDFLVDEL